MFIHVIGVTSTINLIHTLYSWYVQWFIENILPFSSIRCLTSSKLATLIVVITFDTYVIQGNCCGHYFDRLIKKTSTLLIFSSKPVPVVFYIICMCSRRWCDALSKALLKSTNLDFSVVKHNSQIITSAEDVSRGNNPHNCIMFIHVIGVTSTINLIHTLYSWYVQWFIENILPFSSIRCLTSSKLATLIVVITFDTYVIQGNCCGHYFDRLIKKTSTLLIFSSKPVPVVFYIICMCSRRWCDALSKALLESTNLDFSVVKHNSQIITWGVKNNSQNHTRIIRNVKNNDHNCQEFSNCITVGHIWWWDLSFQEKILATMRSTKLPNIDENFLQLLQNMKTLIVWTLTIVMVVTLLYLDFNKNENDFSGV